MRPDGLTRTFRALIVSVLLFPGAFAGAQDQRKDCSGAVEYWQAFAALPLMDERQQNIAASWNTVPLDAAAKGLIDSSATSLKQLHRGSACGTCDWGLHKEDGFALLMPHLSKARELSRLAYLRARYRVAQHEFEPAVQDVADALVLARRAGADSFLVAVLVEDAMEQMGVDAIGPHLRQLDPAALATLEDRLGKLPAGGSLYDSVQVERQFGLKTLVAQLKADPGGADWQQRVSQSIGLGLPENPGDGEAQAQLRAVGSPQKLAERLDQLGPIYDQFPAALKMPQDQAHARLAELRKQGAAIPLGTFVMPDYVRAYDRHTAAQTRIEMLRAAVAIVQKGQDQANNFNDPATGRPFTYRALGGGFELESKLTLDGKPVVLRVGS